MNTLSASSRSEMLSKRFMQLYSASSLSSLEEVKADEDTPIDESELCAMEERLPSELENSEERLESEEEETATSEETSIPFSEESEISALLEISLRLTLASFDSGG